MDSSFSQIQVHALHKSGSMFLYSFFKDVARLTGRAFFSVNETPKTESKAFENNVPNAFIVSPLRAYPETINPNRLHIMVVRNPLDVLVSQYYSHGWMHPLPYDVPSAMDKFVTRRTDIQSKTVDEYAMEYADELLEKHKNLLKFYGDTEHMLITEYAEMVCNFESWCTKICISCGVSKENTNVLYHKFKSEFTDVNELTPEQIMAGNKRHKRKMLPGDHLEKMLPKTIQYLNTKFEKVLALLKYPSLNSSEIGIDSKAREIDLLRFGTQYGEWYIPDIFNNKSVCFCVGSGEDLTFDVLLQSYYDGEVHVFDPTPRAIEHFELVESIFDAQTPTVVTDNPKFGGGDPEYWNILQENKANFKKIFYHDYGISEISGERRFFYPINPEHISCSIENIQNTNEAFLASTLTIKDAMNDTNINRIDLLKLSVQGSEGKIISNMLRDGIRPTVLCVQWDGALQRNYSEELLRNYLNELETAGYKLIYDDERLKHTFILMNDLI
jgi:FkbM family methyltransferase